MTQEAKTVGGDARVSIMHDVFTKAATDYAESTALVCLQHPPDIYSLPGPGTAASNEYLRWTFRQLQRVSHAFAAGLYQKGIRPGMTIAIFPEVGSEFQIIVRAAWELGCTLASLDPATITNTSEVQHMLRCTKPDIILVTTSELANKLEENVPDFTQATLLKLITSYKEASLPHGWSSFQDLFRFGLAHEQLDFSGIERHLDDEILIIFTSGTTSLPKGCVHTNKTISVCCYNKCSNENILESSVISSHSPLFHAIGLLLAIAYVPSGATIVHPAPKFTAGAILQAVAKERITHMTVVPAMLNLLTEHSDLSTTDTSCLVKVQLGGANVLSQHCQACVDTLKADKAHSGFGMSELWTPLQYPFERVPDPKRPEVGNGFVCPGHVLKICEPGSQTPVNRGEKGELHVGGIGLIKRYIGTDAQPFYEDKDGRFFPTGDQAIMGHDGDIYIVGRYKELIIRGGHNIAPAAIENVFSQHAGLQSAVVGLKDDTAGEVPVAVIKKPDVSAQELDSIKQIVVEKLGPAYAPDSIVSLQELGLDDYPKTSSNKIRKLELQPVVQKYFESQEDSHNSDSSNLEETLCALWGRVLRHSSITPQIRITDLADSLVLSRARSQLRRAGMGLTLEEILEHDTVEKQVRLLEERTGHAKESLGHEDLYTKREGPPDVLDMVHAHGSEERARVTAEKCRATLEPLGLDWSDVQDVFPMPDLMKKWSYSLRKQSNNHRHVYLTSSKDTQEVRQALRKALDMHDVLRTIGFKFDDTTNLYAVIRGTDQFYKNKITVLEETVKTAEDIKTVLLNDERHDFAVFPGPLARFFVTKIEETQEVAFMFLGQHSCFDALCTTPFYEDVDKILAGDVESLRSLVPFKPWADLFYSNATSLTAIVETDFHITRLKGIANSSQALFPKQRAAEWFKGHHFGWRPENSVVRDQPLIDARLRQQTHIGVQGLQKEVETPDLSELKKTHNLEPAMVLKAALALVNMLETGADEALFASYQAGRDWPFSPQWVTRRLPPAIDVDGPTLQVAIERVRVDRSQTVLDVIQELNREQAELTKHVHAPFTAISKGLNAADAEVMESVRRRQEFNWLPRPTEFQRMRRVQHLGRADVGLLWDCMSMGQDGLRIHASWDDAQLTKDEVEGMLDKFGRLTKAMVKSQNWNRKVGELVDEILGPVPGI